MLNKITTLLNNEGKTKSEFCAETGTFNQNFNRKFNTNCKVRDLLSLCDYLGYSLQIVDKDGNLIATIGEDDFS